MKGITIIYGLVTLGALAIGIAVPYFTHERGSVAVPGWQFMINPGNLSAKHQFLATQCEACHTPYAGVTADKCIVCHANNQLLLAKQPTAFHAGIGMCPGCHVEHLGVTPRPITMDHVVLARIGVRKASGAPQVELSTLPVAHPHIQPEEMALDCATCHANQDPHRMLFGRDCASCHATSAWHIPEFRHPSLLSMDCAQCHQAPPSHYMEHFRMVSMTVAGIEHADVSQCFLCHKTNAWNDIRGVGWYKHH
jgi:hypothetical protein